MQTQLSARFLATDQGRTANDILRKCVHCGFCNATCPTYQLLGDELDGPRGRIYLVKDLLESGQNLELAKIHLDRCLTCKSCETTCPSGVEYSQLAEIGREFINTHGKSKTFIEKVVLYITPRHKLFRFLVHLGRIFRFLAPAAMKRFLRNKPFSKSRQHKSEGQVVLLQGCVQRAMTPDVVNHLTKILSQRGLEVRVSETERCCGGLHFHQGERQESNEMMKSYMKSVDWEPADDLISSASGCGAVLKDYGRILGDQDAKSFAARVGDVSERLERFEFSKATKYERVALHIPCSLQHGLHLESKVKHILSKTGYELVPTVDEHLCCGSAGTYSIFQNELSERLLHAKVKCLVEHEPDVIATANVGCQLHIASGSKIPVVHWVSLLA